MVLSASSVYSFRVYDDSYAIVEKQLLWVVIGVPCAWVASRLPLRWIRRLAYPGYAISLTLLLLTAFLGVERNGNTNWLALGPIVIQPSEIAKLALILWAAHVYANKDRRLASTHQIMIPVVPGLLFATGLVVLGRDLGTALVLFAILLGMLWVVGAPARFFAFSISVIGVLALFLATTNKERMARITTFVDPFSDYHTAGWQPAHGLYALSSGGVFGQGIGASQQKWGASPRRTPTSSSPCSARSSAWSAPCSSSACSSPSPTPPSASRRTPPTRSSATCPSASWSGCSAR